jgi:hypothetical protein
VTHISSADPIALRRFVYQHILSVGRPPRAVEIGDRFDVSAAEAKRRLAALNFGKTVLIHPDTGEIWMAGPFAASETSYKVIGQRVSWWANCAWDMLGIVAIVNDDVQISARCTDCLDPLTIPASPDRGVSSEWVVHFLLPARRWYDDIGYT